MGTRRLSKSQQTEFKNSTVSIVVQESSKRWLAVDLFPSSSTPSTLCDFTFIYYIQIDWWSCRKDIENTILFIGWPNCFGLKKRILNSGPRLNNFSIILDAGRNCPNETERHRWSPRRPSDWPSLSAPESSHSAYWPSPTGTVSLQDWAQAQHAPQQDITAKNRNSVLRSEIIHNVSLEHETNRD